MSSTPFRFIQRRTTIPGRKPTSNNLYTGEIYIQLADEEIYFLNADASKLVTVVTSSNISGYTSGLNSGINYLSGLVTGLTGTSGTTSVVADVQVNSLSIDKLLTTGDVNNILKIDSSESLRIYVPSGTSIKNGSSLEIAQINIGQALIESQNSGVTIYSNQNKFASNGIGSISRLTKIEDNKWILNGDISSTVTTESVTPKYFSGFSNGDWYNSGNWYSDPQLTIHSTGSPNLLSNIIVEGSVAPSISLNNNRWIQPNSIDATSLTDVAGMLIYATGANMPFSGTVNGNVRFSGIDLS